MEICSTKVGIHNNYSVAIQGKSNCQIGSYYTLPNPSLSPANGKYFGVTLIDGNDLFRHLKSCINLSVEASPIPLSVPLTLPLFFQPKFLYLLFYFSLVWIYFLSKVLRLG